MNIVQKLSTSSPFSSQNSSTPYLIVVVTSKHSSIMPVIVDCASEYTESDSGGDVVEVIEPTNGIAGPPVEPLAEQSVPMSFVE
ncbi:hypothetical protein LIER_13583 [Lithospermum erythrorhizon]|uniref:Uncharacterized protein n=1 Tax=Lithospermum erythrorhizon TaxID=34254 RepID=A0AAV3PWS9_LITER